MLESGRIVLIRLDVGSLEQVDTEKDPIEGPK